MLYDIFLFFWLGLAVCDLGMQLRLFARRMNYGPRLSTCATKGLGRCVSLLREAANNGLFFSGPATKAFFLS